MVRKAYGDVKNSHPGKLRIVAGKWRNPGTARGWNGQRLRGVDAHMRAKNAPTERISVAAGDLWQ